MMELSAYVIHTRKENSGRHVDKEHSKDDIISKQEARIKLLEEQVEMFKKSDVTERRLVNSCINLKSKVLLTDITYIPYGNNNMAYLSTIKDGSSNDILSYHISDSLKIDIVTVTIDKLMTQHKDDLHKDAFVHSDQESFFGHIKDEVNFKTYKTLKEVTDAVDDYIDYYNNYRYQWNLKKMTPKQFRNHLLLAS